ncbi:MAG: hypothetical protein GY810_05425 [Aureispira sp.]|nr:hypothetical protein [Aureispira sp.]
MNNKSTYTLAEANHFFAIEYNNYVWQMIGKPDRTPEEDEEMINAAHASLLHWSKSHKGSIVNIQRGEFMVALVYTYSGRKDNALHHARRCWQITQDNLNQMKGFDVSYAHSVLARAYALSGNQAGFTDHYTKAKETGQQIEKEGDKKLFLEDLVSGPWYNML